MALRGGGKQKRMPSGRFAASGARSSILPGKPNGDIVDENEGDSDCAMSPLPARGKPSDVREKATGGLGLPRRSTQRAVRALVLRAHQQELELKRNQGAVAGACNGCLLLVLRACTSSSCG